MTLPVKTVFFKMMRSSKFLFTQILLNVCLVFVGIVMLVRTVCTVCMGICFYYIK